ncbi:MAG: hypothetical protein WAO12_10295 [Venatoribacter sp.]
MIKNILSLIGGAYLISKGYELYYEHQKEKELQELGRKAIDENKKQKPDSPEE